MKSIDIADIATVLVSEFVKKYGHLCYPDERYDDKEGVWIPLGTPFLKMNYMRRRKLVQKIVDKLGER